MRCPFCGAENTGKFCTNCGTKIPEEQAPAAPVYQAPAQDYVPIQPIEPYAPEASNDSEPEYVPIQPTYATPITQPVQKRVKSNGWCSSGLILSITAWFCLGLTSPFGFICSFIGLFDSRRKHQPGRGQAIAGLILSGIIIVSMGSLIALSYKDIQRAVERGDIRTPMDVIELIDEATDRQDTTYKAQVKKVTGKKWIEGKDDSYLVFGSKDSFKYYQTYKDTKDNYYSGTYRVYVGNDAYKQITKTYAEYGVTREELNSLIKKNNLITRDDLVCLVVENDGCWMNGKNVKDEKWETVYYGYYIEEPYRMLYLVNMTTATQYQFVPEEDFKK